MRVGERNQVWSTRDHDELGPSDQLVDLGMPLQWADPVLRCRDDRARNGCPGETRSFVDAGRLELELSAKG
jgi:hypothetical protein